MRVEAGWLQAAVDEQHVLVYDGRGRLFKAFWEGRAYDIALDNRVLEKWQDRVAGRRQRRLLQPGQASWLRQAARQAASHLLQAKDVGVVLKTLPESRGEPPQEAPGSSPGAVLAWREWLARAAEYSEERWAEDARRFAAVYQPVSILPPDQYASLVLQATLGCSYNRCTFCTFYRGRPFRVRRPEEFRRHVEAVREMLGAGLGRYREIFLADANALAAPEPLLLSLFELAAQALPHVVRPRISSFLDVLTGQHKSVADFAALVDRGLDRVYLGLESGSEELLRFLNKPSPPQAAIRLVEAIKQAGAAVGVIFLVGAGGERYRTVHRQRTLALVQQLPLDGRDLIYLSPLVDEGSREYEERLQAEGSEALSEEALTEELQLLWRLMREQVGTGLDRPRVGLYDIREFVY
ncbi:MAG: B12-binding domain-containing radical SAM protein [Limnochordaceae bacterium]|nr:B12-binding domain-containing radical SAM protein [Limnochordaceae bacterium]